jgi:hypothetical protein
LWFLPTAARSLSPPSASPLLEPDDRELRLLRSWLSTWTGIGHVIVGMHRQGYDGRSQASVSPGKRPSAQSKRLDVTATVAVDIMQ